MKKFKALFALIACLIAMPSFADEGMWLLPLLEKMNIKTMQEMGCKLSAEDIYSINKTSLKDAVISFGGGCTGEVVSNQGLILTNYHCGYGNIQRLSSVEHDYITDGFWAMNLAQELPCEGLSVTFLESMTDVTDQIVNAGKNADKVREKLISNAKAKDKYLDARITTMYGGNAYYLLVTKRYTDVRFVGAAPYAVSKLGHETDNWTWPRHQCDFAMFRIYADKNNNPAPYSPDNVPYTPKKSFTISMKGVQDGDFAMVIGYPGSTNRFMTTSELVETRDIQNAITIQCRGIRQEILREDMNADPKVNIQYASKYASSSNAWKKYIGMNQTFAKLNVEQRRGESEKEFTKWVNEDNTRKEKFGKALEKIRTAVEARSAARKVNTYLNETLGRIEISSQANTIYNLAVNPRGGNFTEAVKTRSDSFYKDYNMPTDVKVAKRLISLYKENVPTKLPSFYATIDSQFGGSIDAFVEDLFDKSIFTSQEKLLAALEGKDAAAAAQLIAQDPAYLLSASYRPISQEMQQQISAVSAQFSEGKKEYIAGTLAMRPGEAIYPDANSTMRLTYGQIKPYEPRDGVIYKSYTTLTGYMEKEDPTSWEFQVSQFLKDLYNNKDYGKYARPDGELQTCFISTCDITGGNSGSPAINGEGQLVGIAFDGNWEAMSGDIIFEPDYQRTICVDIRFVLFAIDKIGNASYLFNEMNIVE